jgi:SPP1 family holin
MEEDNNMDKASVTRVVALVIVLINAVLNLFGFETIPTEFGEHISALVLIVVSLWSAWKNNYLSKKGGLQKKALQDQGLYKR